MAKQTIDLGSVANDGTGTTLRAGGDIINDNFTEVYDSLVASSVKTIYESNADTNAYTDAEKTQAALQTGANTGDNAVNTLYSDAVLNADTSTTPMQFVIDEDNFSSNLATKVPTQQSTKAYIASQIASAIVGGVYYQGSYNAGTNSPDLETPTAGTIFKGFMWTVTVLGDFFTEAVQVGDVLIAEIDDPSALTDWTIVQSNLDASSIKALYESNTNTNAFTDAEQTKLGNQSGTNTGDSQTLASGVSDVTATAAEVNLLDLAGLTAGDILSADTSTTASWKTPPPAVATLEELTDTNITTLTDEDLLQYNYASGKWKNISPSASVIAGQVAIHDQGSPVTVWTFNHNLDLLNPNIQVWSTALANGEVILPEKIIAKTVNQAEIHFNVSVSGRATATKGGTALTSGLSDHTLLSNIGTKSHATLDSEVDANNAKESSRYSINTIATSTTAVAFNLYIFTSSLTLTLPVTAAEGDSIKISDLSNTSTSIIARNGHKIMGVAADLTLDTPYTGIEMIYTGVTQGWVLIGIS